MLIQCHTLKPFVSGNSSWYISLTEGNHEAWTEPNPHCTHMPNNVSLSSLGLLNFMGSQKSCKEARYIEGLAWLKKNNPKYNLILTIKEVWGKSKETLCMGRVRYCACATIPHSLLTGVALFLEKIHVFWITYTFFYCSDTSEILKKKQHCRAHHFVSPAPIF